MESHQRVLLIDVGSTFYRIDRFTVVDNFLGLLILGFTYPVSKNL